ncbi:MAG: DNA-binding protein [Gemmatimonadota bacterium]|nr:DNA-binding protein [Gemmatimonadota bacterium]
MTQKRQKTLFLAWQDKRGKSRPWFPLGRLDIEPTFYRFRYTGGAARAQQELKYPPLPSFPQLHRDYRSSALFYLFQNRVMKPNRPDFADHVQRLDLPENADPFEMLSVSGGYRVTDDYEVFPKLVKAKDGSFVCRFFLHGWRHTSLPAQERLNALKPGEELYVALELANPVTNLAVQLQTTDYHMIGWTPRYIVSEMARAMTEAPLSACNAQAGGNYTAHVVKVNPPPSPMTQRVLIEMRGWWDGYEPMESEDFRPLIGD